MALEIDGRQLIAIVNGVTVVSDEAMDLFVATDPALAKGLAAVLPERVARYEASYGPLASPMPGVPPTVAGRKVRVAPRKLAHCFTGCLDLATAVQLGQQVAVKADEARRLFHKRYYGRRNRAARNRQFWNARHWAEAAGEIQTRFHEGIEYLIILRSGKRA